MSSLLLPLIIASCILSIISLISLKKPGITSSLLLSSFNSLKEASKIEIPLSLSIRKIL